MIYQYVGPSFIHKLISSLEKNIQRVCGLVRGSQVCRVLLKYTKTKTGKSIRSYHECYE